MSLYADKKTYKGYDILFWETPKTIKATIWKKHKLVKKFYVRTKTYQDLKKRVIGYINDIN